MLDFRAGFYVGVRASFLYGALARFSAQRLFVRHRYTRYENTRYQSRENTTTVVAPAGISPRRRNPEEAL